MTSRPVLPLESMFLRAPRPFVSICVRVRGDVGVRRYLRAVSRLLRLCPTLGARVVRGAQGIASFEMAGLRVPVRVVTRQSEATWRESMQRDWREPFPWDIGPFSRFTLVYSPEVSELMYLGHHALIDGVGKAKIMDMLLRLIDDPDARLEVDIETLPTAENMRRCVPERKLKNAGILLRNGFDACIYAVSAWRWKRTRFSLSPDVYAAQMRLLDQYEYVWADRELSEEKTFALNRLCKERGVTLNSLITVAFLHCRHRIDPQHENNRQMVSVDLRRHLGRQAQKGIGDYASSLDIRYAYRDSISFWENVNRFHARVRKQLEQFIDARKPLLLSRVPSDLTEIMNVSQRMITAPDTFRDLPEFRKMGPGSWHIAAQFGKGSLRELPTFTTTNLGVGKFSPRYGDLAVERCYVFPSCAFYPAFTVILSSLVLNRRMSFIMNVAKPLDGSIPAFDETFSALVDGFTRFLTDEVFTI